MAEPWGSPNASGFRVKLHDCQPVPAESPQKGKNLEGESGDGSMCSFLIGLLLRALAMLAMLAAESLMLTASEAGPWISRGKRLRLARGLVISAYRPSSPAPNCQHGTLTHELYSHPIPLDLRYLRLHWGHLMSGLVGTPHDVYSVHPRPWTAGKYEPLLLSVSKEGRERRQDSLEPQKTLRQRRSSVFFFFPILAAATGNITATRKQDFRGCSFYLIGLAVLEKAGEMTVAIICKGMFNTTACQHQLLHHQHTYYCATVQFASACLLSEAPIGDAKASRTPALRKQDRGLRRKTWSWSSSS